MSETREPDGAAVHPGLVTVVAGLLVLVLAAGAAFWPQGRRPDQTHSLLVFDSSGASERVPRVYEPLGKYLGEITGQALRLTVVRTVVDYRSALVAHPDFVFVPDGLALQTAGAGYLPLAVGRRSAPYNLRPRSVLVARRGTTSHEAPWLTDAGATVFGDSLSLAATAGLRRAGFNGLPRGSAAGPDPYDHSAALHALRLGGFDYAVVRQWDAARFRARGLLPVDEYQVTLLEEPVPDVVVMVSGTVPSRVRLRCGEILSSLGRDQDTPLGERLRRGMTQMHLAGFNLLVGPDFDLVQKKYRGDWLPGGG